MHKISHEITGEESNWSCVDESDNKMLYEYIEQKKLNIVGFSQKLQNFQFSVVWAALNGD